MYKLLQNHLLETFQIISFSTPWLNLNTFYLILSGKQRTFDAPVQCEYTLYSVQCTVYSIHSRDIIIQLFLNNMH